MGEYVDGKYVTEPRDGDWAVLAHVSDEPRRARDVAAALYGKTIQQVMDSGQSAELVPCLARLCSSGYVEKDYYNDRTVVSYVLTDRGRERLREREFAKLLQQAA